SCRGSLRRRRMSAARSSSRSKQRKPRATRATPEHRPARTTGVSPTPSVSGMDRPPLIALMGPTAAGKTDLAVAAVERWPVDLVSVDSALVYRGMDIGSAKPEIATLARAPHRLIDIREPWEPYSAADFAADARREIAARSEERRGGTEGGTRCRT